MASIKERGFKKVAILSSMDAFGQSGGAIAQESVQAAGLSLVATETFAPQDTNMTPQLLRSGGGSRRHHRMVCKPGAHHCRQECVGDGLNKPIFLSVAQSSITCINQAGPRSRGRVRYRGAYSRARGTPRQRPA